MDNTEYRPFHAGREETSIYQHAMIGFFLDLLRTILLKAGFDRRKVMRFIGEFARTFKFKYSDKVNDYIIADEEYLDVRIEGDVDLAVDRVKAETDWTPVETAKPVIIVEDEGETLLGGPMRATYDFVVRDEPSNKTNGNEEM